MHGQTRVKGRLHVTLLHEVEASPFVYQFVVVVENILRESGAIYP